MFPINPILSIERVQEGLPENFSRLNNVNSFSLSLWKRCSIPLLIFVTTSALTPSGSFLSFSEVLCTGSFHLHDLQQCRACWGGFFGWVFVCLGFFCLLLFCFSNQSIQRKFPSHQIFLNQSNCQMSFQFPLLFVTLQMPHIL